MVSDVYPIHKDTNLEKLLDEVGRVGEFCGLQRTEAERLKMLCEEMISLVQHLLHVVDCCFWMEAQGRRMELYLKAEAPVTLEQKDALLSLSSSGKNEATRGVLGKIKGVFQSFLMGENEMAADGIFVPESDGVMDNYAELWSLTVFQDALAEREQQPEWDDSFERCVIASMADDVLVGVRGTGAEIVVKVDFDKA